MNIAEIADVAPRSIVGISLDRMLIEKGRPQGRIYKAPRWRVVHRHRLAYKIYMLDQDISLLSHVLGEDE